VGGAFDLEQLGGLAAGRNRALSASVPAIISSGLGAIFATPA
jgi:hypothetical protein